MHELFHCIQPLETSGEGRGSAIADAIAFRSARYQRFRTAAAAEHPIEINEGLATYTQYVLGWDGMILVPLRVETLPGT
jgi:hypothetical protein